VVAVEDSATGNPGTENNERADAGTIFLALNSFVAKFTAEIVKQWTTEQVREWATKLDVAPGCVQKLANKSVTGTDNCWAILIVPGMSLVALAKRDFNTSYTILQSWGIVSKKESRRSFARLACLESEISGT
jgi:hypothetical protein